MLDPTNRINQIVSVMIVLALIGFVVSRRTPSTTTITQYTGIPQSEWWQVKAVLTGNSLLLTNGKEDRRILLCGVMPIQAKETQAKAYLQQLVNPNQMVAVTFLTKTPQGLLSEVWVNPGENNEEIVNTDCPNGDLLRSAEQIHLSK